MDPECLAVADAHHLAASQLLCVERGAACDEQIDLQRRLLMDQVRAAAGPHGTAERILVHVEVGSERANQSRNAARLDRSHDVDVDRGPWLAGE